MAQTMSHARPALPINSSTAIFGSTGCPTRMGGRVSLKREGLRLGNSLAVSGEWGKQDGRGWESGLRGSMFFFVSLCPDHKRTLAGSLPPLPRRHTTADRWPTSPSALLTLCDQLIEQGRCLGRMLNPAGSPSCFPHESERRLRDAPSKPCNSLEHLGHLALEPWVDPLASSLRFSLNVTGTPPVTAT